MSHHRLTHKSLTMMPSRLLATLFLLTRLNLYNSWLLLQSSPRIPTALSFFDKIFEESGPLGKGITVGKVQVALQTRDRSSNSILGTLESTARRLSGSSSSAVLARAANDVCLALLRLSDEWLSASSTRQWFGQNDAGKAERQFNDWANKEASKFEKVRDRRGRVLQPRRGLG